jgi:hypothetical protein
MTTALQGAVRASLAEDPAEALAAWEAMERFARFQVLTLIGDQVLPVLVALPEVVVEPGTRATYADEEVGAAAAPLLADEFDRAQGDGTWLALPDQDRADYLDHRVGLVQEVLSQMPLRQDPDALVVPDHL